TPVGEYGEGMRYHHLFQEFLQRRLRSERPHEAEQILERVVEVSLHKQQWEQAYFYVERMDDPSAIIDLVEQNGLRLIHTGRIKLLHEWLSKLPTHVVNVRPRLIGLWGICWIQLGQVEDGVKRLNEAE